MLAQEPPDFLPPVKAPPLRLLALEGRAAAEMPLFVLRSLSLQGLPRGDGHPVIVIPGFGADDLASLPLRHALRRLGYSVYGWEQKRNLGMRPQIKLALANMLKRLSAKHKSRVTLIGWSLGGIFAREMARHQPELVRRVFTLGSPFNGAPDANNMQLLFRLANRGKAVRTDREGFERRRRAPPVPCVAIHTKSDGIVAWRCSLEEPAPNTENVEVRGSHFGLLCNYEVLRVLAERLPLPADERQGLGAGKVASP
jgi:pimeloyl-ACP methyl ester carboxylesterase